MSIIASYRRIFQPSQNCRQRAAQEVFPVIDGLGRSLQEPVMKVAREAWSRGDWSVKVDVDQVFQQMTKRDTIENAVADVDDDLNGLPLASRNCADSS